MPFPQNYTVKIETTLRTLTINERFSHSLNTANLPASATPVAQDFINVVTNGGLSVQSIQGHFSFPAQSYRQLGGQARYSTGYDPATPSVLQNAVPVTVEPEHRVAFAISQVEAATTLTLAAAIQNRVLQALYEYALYKH